MQFWLNFALYRLMEEAGADVTGASVVADPVATEPNAVETVQEPVSEPTNDVLTQLDDVLKGLEPAQGATDPAAHPVDPQNDPIAPFLQVSPFVTSPEHVQAAIQAADEVWKVATGQGNASQLLEGMRAANPQGFEKVIGDLIPYVEQITGRKFTDQASTPPDPAQARLDALEKRIAQEDEQRRQAVVQQQIDTARGKASEFITAQIKGTFAEGMQDRYLAPDTGLLWAKAAQMQIAPDRLMGELLQGKTDTVAKLLKAVQADELKVVKQYTAGLVKHHKTLTGAVPAAGAVKQANPKDMAPLPGESAAQHAERLVKLGLI